MKRAAVLTSILLAGLLIASAATAAPMLVGVGSFGSSTTIITFEGLAVGTQITNQYAGQDVLFSGGLHATALVPAWGISATNGDPDPKQDITLDFTHQMARVGFDILTNGPDKTQFLVSAFKNGVLTGTGSFVVDTKLEPIFVGFEDSSDYIDRLVINAFTDQQHPDAGFIINDLRLQVPEPVSLSLLGLGLAGVAIRRRRGNAS